MCSWAWACTCTVTLVARLLSQKGYQTVTLPQEAGALQLNNQLRSFKKKKQKSNSGISIRRSPSL
jgi:hypothetical protein